MVADPPRTPMARRLQLTPVQEAQFVSGQGRQICERTGHYGRTGVFEMLQVTPAIRTAILDNADSAQISSIAAVSGRLSRAVNLATQPRTTASEILSNVVPETN
jgi:type II secretory ATPase GspE/PulE/Tfp pilus assembly ATPase PilB-like protein